MDVSSDKTSPLNVLPHAILSRWLLEIYLIVPLCCLVVVADIYGWNGHLRAALSNTWSVQHFVWIAFYVNYPHLIANVYSFMDGDYVRFYKHQLLMTLAATCALVFAVQPWVGPVTTSLIFWIITAYHVVMQEIGVTRILGFNSGPAFRVWKWLIVTTQIVLTLLLVSRLDLLNRRIPAVNLHAAGQWTLIVQSILIAATTLFSFKKIRSVNAGLAMGSNSLMILIAVILYFAGYGFFSLLMITTVHNVTAFLFYILHDMNRNAATRPNISYRFLHFTGLPIWLQSIVLSMAFGYLGVRFASQYWGIQMIAFVSYFHYISDGYAWKRGSLHRQYTPVMV